MVRAVGQHRHHRVGVLTPTVRHPAPTALSGTWKVAAATDERRRSYTASDFDPQGWVALDVPGHHQQAGPLRQVRGPVLWHRSFSLEPDAVGTSSDDRHWLTFSRVLGTAEVWCNDQYLGDTGEAFDTTTFEITAACRGSSPGSSHALALELSAERDVPGRPQRTLHRAFFQPTADRPLPDPAGLCEAPTVRSTGAAALLRVSHVCVSADEYQARVTTTVEVDAVRSARAWVTSVIDGHPHLTETPLAPGPNTIEFTQLIPEPRRWWPAEMGDPTVVSALVSITLDDPDTPASDQYSGAIGLRSVHYRRRTWTVNGQPIYLRGTTQGPLSLLPAALTDADIAGFIADVRDAHLNSVRIRQHIADPRLYRAADEAGLVLLQDLPISGQAHRSISSRLTSAARTLPRVLGHHPSIIGWIAHDRPSTPWAPSATDAAATTQFGLAARLVRQTVAPSWNRDLLDPHLRNELRRTDPSRPTFESWGTTPRLRSRARTAMRIGHDGLIERPELIRPAMQAWPRLAQLIGTISAPTVPLDTEFCPTESWPKMDWAVLAGRHGAIVDALLTQYPPDHFATFDEFANAVRVGQARYLQRTIETVRSINRSKSAGYFQADLRSPGALLNASVVDHAGQRGPGWQALAAASQPLLPVADWIPHQMQAGIGFALDLRVVNDLHVDLERASLIARFEWDDRVHTWRWSGGVAAQSVVTVGTMQLAAPLRTTDVSLRLMLSTGGETVENIYIQRIDVANTRR